MSDHMLHLGDCLQGLDALGHASVDHLICDPPYSAYVDANSRKGNGHKPGGQKKDLVFEPLTTDTRYAVAAHMARAARRWVLVFCDIESAPDWRDALADSGLRYVRTGAWLKGGATPQFTGDRPAVAFEAIVIAHAAQTRLRWNGGGKHAAWSCLIAHRTDEVVHPTQKPVDLMEQLVSDFTDPGDLICDPFAGSGTTGVACKRLGRRFVGWEKDEVFWGRAVRRLEETRQQYELLPRPPKAKQTGFLP